MKKVPIALLVLALAFCAALASAQQPQQQQQGQLEITPGEQAAVRVAHLSPDAANIDISINGVSAFQGVGYRDVTAYEVVPAGSVEVSITAGGAQEPLISATLEVEAGVYYTIAALGPEEALEARVYRDNLRAFPPSNGASIRVLHASPAAGAVDVAVRDGDVLVQNLNFGQVSEYFFVPAGTYDIDVREAGTENVAFGIDNLEVRPGHVYTHFVIGGPEGEQVTQQDQVQETTEQEQPAEEEPTETAQPTTQPDTAEPDTAEPTATEPDAAAEPADPEATPEEEQEQPTGQEDTQQVQAIPVEEPETEQQTDQQQTQQQAEPADTEEAPEEEEEQPTGQEDGWLVRSDAPVLMHINQQTAQQTQQQQTQQQQTQQQQTQQAAQPAAADAEQGNLTINMGADATRLQVLVTGPDDYSETLTIEEEQTLEGLQPGTYTVTVIAPRFEGRNVELQTDVEVQAGETATATVPVQPGAAPATAATAEEATEEAEAAPAEEAPAEEAPAEEDAAAATELEAGEGALEILIEQAGVTVEVTGPQGYNQTVTQSQTLIDLVPGTYIVATTGEGIQPRLQEVEVTGNEVVTVVIDEEMPVAEPTEEPEPVEEPEPTEEPEPVDEPEPTEEPEPTVEPDPAVEEPAPGEFEVIITVDARMFGTTEDEDQDQNQGQN